MILEIHPASTVPPYQQLREQVADLAADGSLAPGHRLPSVRQLAADLGVAPGTVARAYRELEADGIVRTHGRRGTAVAGDAASAEGARRVRRLDEAAEAYAERIRQLGVDVPTAIDRLRAAMGDSPVGDVQKSRPA